MPEKSPIWKYRKGKNYFFRKDSQFRTATANLSIGCLATRIYLLGSSKGQRPLPQGQISTPRTRYLFSIPHLLRLQSGYRTLLCRICLPDCYPALSKSMYSILIPKVMSPVWVLSYPLSFLLLPGPNSLSCHALMLFAPPAKKHFSYGRLFAFP